MTGTSQYTADEIDLNIDVEKDLEIYVDVSIESHVIYESDVNSTIVVDAEINGNSATFSVDVEAFGESAATELNLAAIATDDHSGITVTGFAAVGGDGKDDGGGGGEEPPPPPPPPPPPQDNFPQWPQDISNVVLYFAADGANDPDDVNDDGYVLVKIDDWPTSGDDDLDNSLNSIMDYLLVQGVIEDDSDFLGAAIKGGNEDTAFYADDGDHDVDPIPPGAPQIETPPPQGQVPGPEIDYTFNYSAVFA